jgi:hypothetical protein
MLTRSERFAPDDNFTALNPTYNITAKDIEQRIISALSASQS